MASNMPWTTRQCAAYGNNGYGFSYGGGGVMGQSIIEVDGQIQFTLPGQPRFPKLADDTILKPTLEWQLRADKPAKLDAELCYVTGGMSWEAAYNVVSPEKGDILDLTGWVTMDNQSGKDFRNAKIKLMAGDVSRLQSNGGSHGLVHGSCAQPCDGG